LDRSLFDSHHLPLHLGKLGRGLGLADPRIYSPAPFHDDERVRAKSMGKVRNSP
jgi:hypothetical protein